MGQKKIFISPSRLFGPFFLVISILLFITFVAMSFCVQAPFPPMLWEHSGEAGGLISFFPNISSNLQNSRVPSEQDFQAGIASTIIGDFQSAQNHFSDYFKLKIVRTDSNIDLANLIGLGMAFEALGDSKFAYGYFKLAAAISLQQWYMLPPSQCNNFLKGKVERWTRLDLFEALVRLSFLQHDPAGAFYWGETIHNLMLAEKVACGNETVQKLIPHDVYETENILRHRFVSTYQKMKAALDRKDRIAFMGLTREIENLNSYKDKLRVQLLKKYPNYISQFYFEPIKPRAILLEPREAIVEYLVTEQHTFAWLIKDHRIARTMVINLGREELEAKIGKYMNNASTQGSLNKRISYDHRLGEELYDLLLKRLVLASDKVDKLIVIPDKILFDLPFQTIVKSTADKLYWETGRRQQAENVVDLEYWQSATIFHILRNRE